MEKTCAKCSFWKTNCNAGKAIGYNNKFHCGLLSNLNNKPKLPENAQLDVDLDTRNSNDNSVFDVYTGPNFGCIHFEEKK